MALFLAQAAPFFDDAWVHALELIGTGIFCSVTTIAVFRGRLSVIGDKVATNTDSITAHKKEQAANLAVQRKELEQGINAAEERLTGKIAELRNLIVQRENSEVLETLRAENRLASQFDGLRKENSDRHTENRRDRRVDRRQQYTLLEILVDSLPARGRKQVDAAMKMLRVEMDTESEADAA